MTDDPRVGGMAGDEPVNDDAAAAGGEDPHAAEENTAQALRDAPPDAAGNTDDQAVRGLEQAQDQPGYGREGS